MNNEFSAGIIMDSRLKHNVLCQFTNETMLDDTVTKARSSTLKAHNANTPSVINSPSPPTLQEIVSDEDKDDDSLPDEHPTSFPCHEHASVPHCTELSPHDFTAIGQSIY